MFAGRGNFPPTFSHIENPLFIAEDTPVGQYRLLHLTILYLSLIQSISVPCLANSASRNISLVVLVLPFTVRHSSKNVRSKAKIHNKSHEIQLNLLTILHYRIGQ